MEVLIAAMIHIGGSVIRWVFIDSLEGIGELSGGKPPGNVLCAWR